MRHQAAEFSSSPASFGLSRWRCATLAILAAIALSACGGGGEGASLTAGTAAADPTPARALDGPFITLTNLPSNPTASTAASINYSASSGTVYCRLDSYSPIACPNPFVLGATPPQALSVGTHKVDFYLDTGSGINVSSPMTTYSWVVQQIVLGNLPASHTTSTSASITFTAFPGTVYCRLDSYAPILCPSPFALGATPEQALSVGTHKVDFYLDTGSGINVAQPVTTYSWTVDAASSVVLSNLPSNPTTSTSASISYTASPGTVYCRLDSYAPILCPNPFALGATPEQALAVGTHKVDFYLDIGSGINAGAPITSYTWVVTAPSATPIPSAFQAGADYAIEAPNATDTSGYAAKPYANGLSIPPLSNLATVSRSGVTRLGPTTVDSQPVIRHAVYPGDPTRHDGHRSELSYDSVPIWHGSDYWMSFAVKLDSDWTVANSGGSSDRQSIMQVHQEETSPNWNSGGPFGIVWKGGSAGQEIEIFTDGAPDWSGSGTYTGGGTVTTRFTTASNPGGWQRFVIHYRSGVRSSQAPTLEVWVANGTGAFTKLTDQAPNTLFGDPAQASTHDYAKVGIYKWTYGNYGSGTKRGMYSSGLFFQQGTNLFEAAKAAVEPFNR